VSQRIRKRIEEAFGWMKTLGGLRKTRYRGRERVQMNAYLVAAAYNLLRIGRLVTSCKDSLIQENQPKARRSRSLMTSQSVERAPDRYWLSARLATMPSS